MTYTERAQEWLADRVKWVQYPQIRSSRIKRHLFLNQMPGPLRIGLVLYGVAALVVCAVVLFFLGLLFWAIFTA
jgi:hypothetical protein